MAAERLTITLPNPDVSGLSSTSETPAELSFARDPEMRFRIRGIQRKETKKQNIKIAEKRIIPLERKVFPQIKEANPDNLISQDTYACGCIIQTHADKTINHSPCGSDDCLFT
jgi:hypothetical protein